MAKGKGKMTRKGNNAQFSLFSLVPLLVYGGMLKYLYDLNRDPKCACAINDQQQTLKNLMTYWFAITIALTLLTMFDTKRQLMGVGSILALVAVFLFFYIAFVFYRYEQQLQASDCKCADDIKKTVFKYYLLILFIMMGLNFIYAMMVMAFVQALQYQTSGRVVKMNL